LIGRIAELNREIARRAPDDEVWRRLMTIPGIGPLAVTADRACSATEAFAKGRDFDGADHRKALRRPQVLPFFAKLPPCLIGIEACGTLHHWARELAKLGHKFG
jgi:transposase